MEAAIYNLERMRSQRNTRTIIERIYPAQLALDGSALMMNATLFWVEYAKAMVSFHARLLSLK